MTDINKFIQQEAEMYVDSIYYNTDDVDCISFIKNSCKEDFKAGASFILHHYRWRKVSEELPEVRKNTYFINVKKSGVRIETIAILSGIEDVKEFLEFYDITEWKPIE